jgi:hypothetical protein
MAAEIVKLVKGLPLELLVPLTRVQERALPEESEKVIALE